MLRLVARTSVRRFATHSRHIEIKSAPKPPAAIDDVVPVTHAADERTKKKPPTVFSALPSLREPIITDALHTSESRPLVSDHCAVTLLENGARVAQRAGETSLAALGVAIEAGVHYETGDDVGMSQFAHLLHGDLIGPELNKAVLDSGGSIHCVTTRDRLMLYVRYVDGLLPIETAAAVLEKFLRAPELEQRHIDAAVPHVRDQMMHLSPEQFIADRAFEHCFPQQRLGNSELVCAHRLLEGGITPQRILEYMGRTFTADRCTFAYVGSGSVLEQLHQSTLGMRVSGRSESAAVGERVHMAKGVPYGECEYVNVNQENAAMLFAFDGPTVHEVPQLIAAQVMQKLLGGGASFSSGGPGKGMHSLLYRNVLCQQPGVESLGCFVLPHEQFGLFVFNATVSPQVAPRIGSILRRQVEQLQSGEMRAERLAAETKRAKNQLKRFIFTGLDMIDVQFEDMVHQVSHYGRHYGQHELSQLIDDVTERDMQAMARTMLDQEPLVVTYTPKQLHLPTWK